MKTAIVNQTKRRTLIALDGKMYTFHNNLQSNNYHERELLPNETVIGVKIEGETLEEVYNKFFEPIKAERKIKDAERQALKIKMEAVIENAKEHTPKEIWQAVKWAVSQGWGWQAADILIQDNPLAKQLVNKLQSYTVSAYDDNSIMIKAGSKRYGTLRKWASVDDLL